MKKLLAILLALVVVGGAFAQVTTAVSLSGAVYFADQDGNASFVPDGYTYDTLTFKGTDADGKFGFAITDADLFSADPFQIRDWNAWFKGAYTKVIVGRLRNADIRMADSFGGYSANLAATDRFFGASGSAVAPVNYGMIVESTTLGALTLGLGLPITDTAEQTLDVIQKANLGVAYTIENVGKAILLVRPDFVNDSQVVNFGFSYTGVENLNATVLYKGTFATTNTQKFSVGAKYTMDKLYGGAIFGGTYTTALAWDIYAKVGYQVLDNLAAALVGKYNDLDVYSVNLNAEYDLGTGLSLGGDVGYADKLTCDLYAYYSISL